MLIAGSFGEVFRDNCIRNGILPIVAAPEALDPLRALLRDAPGPVRLRVDLAGQQVEGPGFTMAFDLPSADKTALLDGLDEIGMTLLQADAIGGWEQREGVARPWLQHLRAPR